MAIKVQFEIGHSAKLKKNPETIFTHDWELYVQGIDKADISQYVEKVVFNLHNSFKKPRRTCKEPPYMLKESGYAGFSFPIDIHFRNRDEPKLVTFTYDLDLHQTGPYQRSEKKEFIFDNPSEDFRQKLLKGGGIVVTASGTVGGDKIRSSSSSNSSNSIPNTNSNPAELINKPKLSNTSDNSAMKKIKIRPDDSKNSTFANLFGPPITKTSAKVSPSGGSSGVSGITGEKVSPTTNSSKNQPVASKDSKSLPSTTQISNPKDKSEIPGKKEKYNKHNSPYKDKNDNGKKDDKHDSSSKHEKREERTEKKKDKSHSKERGRSREKSSKQRPTSPQKHVPSPVPVRSSSAASREDPAVKKSSSSHEKSSSISSTSSSKKSKKEKKDKHGDKDKERSERKEKEKRDSLTSTPTPTGLPSTPSGGTPTPNLSSSSKSNTAVVKSSTTEKKPPSTGNNEKPKSSTPTVVSDTKKTSEKDEKRHKHKKKDKNKDKEKNGSNPSKEHTSSKDKRKDKTVTAPIKNVEVETSPPRKQQKISESEPVATNDSESESRDKNLTIQQNSESSNSSFPDLMPNPKVTARQLKELSVSPVIAVTPTPPAPIIPPPAVIPVPVKEKKERKNRSDKQPVIPKETEKMKRRRNSMAVGNTFVEPPLKQQKKDAGPKNGHEKSKSQSPLPTVPDETPFFRPPAPAVTTPSASVVPPNADYMELQELHQKIMTLQDNKELQQVVELIAETGNYEITSRTFDFDLCKLDRVTVQRLQEFFATSVS